MARLRGDYHPEAVEASLSVLVELATMLRSYQDALVLIGGWVPYFILQQYGEKQTEFRHVGSIDIDLVIDPAVITEDVYATITDSLLERGYQPSPNILYQFSRTVTASAGGQQHTVGVDFLSPRGSEGRGRGHRHRLIQPGLKARVLDGAEIALAHSFLVPISGRLPGDGWTQVSVRAGDVVACLALKGLALGERYREKDAYDGYAVCAYHRGGPAGVADRLRTALSDPILQRGLEAIADRFQSLESEGPWWVANFLAREGSEQHARVRQDAFMTVQEVVRLLAMPPGP